MSEKYSDAELDYVGDHQILELLEASRIAFEGGDKFELLKCVFRCARFQAVIPEWAADALLAIQEDLEDGRLADPNAAFGRPSERASTRASRARKRDAKAQVLAELWRLRWSGGSLNDAEMFPEALENLRASGLDVNHRDIKEIYSEHGAFLKEVPRNDQNTVRGFMDVTYPKPRRRGRKILRD
jgi:hypothetical protein